jgi:hypothetical protein
LKLDITKFFNTVDWSFLLEVLRKMGFGARLLPCIYALLSTASTHVLMNGSPRLAWPTCMDFVKGTPSLPTLHPGHGSSPLCFGEGDAGRTPGPPHYHRSPATHIIYTDDVVAFIHPSVGDLRSFAAIIKDFGAASGLHTNLSKCSTHLIRCLVEVAAFVDQILVCPVLPFPLRYLDLPLGLGKPTVRAPRAGQIDIGSDPHLCLNVPGCPDRDAPSDRKDFAWIPLERPK